jgi:hypothetical protein
MRTPSVGAAGASSSYNKVSLLVSISTRWTAIGSSRLGRLNKSIVLGTLADRAIALEPLW